VGGLCCCGWVWLVVLVEWGVFCVCGGLVGAWAGVLCLACCGALGSFWVGVWVGVWVCWSVDGMRWWRGVALWGSLSVVLVCGVLGCLCGVVVVVVWRVGCGG